MTTTANTSDLLAATGTVLDLLRASVLSGMENLSKAKNKCHELSSETFGGQKPECLKDADAVAQMYRSQVIAMQTTVTLMEALFDDMIDSDHADNLYAIPEDVAPLIMPFMEDTTQVSFLR